MLPNLPLPKKKSNILKQLPTGPYMLAIIPLGKTTDWYLIPCTRLFPLQTVLWFCSGRQIGLTVPSSKPTQLGNGLSFEAIARA